MMIFIHLILDYPQFVVEQQRDVQEHGAIKKSKLGKLFITDLYNYHCICSSNMQIISNCFTFNVCFLILLVSSDRTELNQLDPVVEARYLKQEFEELLVDIQNLIQEVDLDNLKLRITWFFNAENAITPEIHNKVDKLQSLTTPQNVLNFLIINSFIGYLNYEIIKAFQKATKSEEMKIKIEEYEKKHDVFLHQFPYGSLIDAFKQNSELAPVSVVGLPKFTVKLATTWEGKSAYTWKEFFQNIFTWPPHLIIVSIERNCIVLTYAVLPFFVSSVVRDLQNPLIIKQLKKEGVSVELSPDLSKMGEKENNTEGLQEGEVTGKRETLSKIGEGNTFQKEQEVVGKIGKSSGVEDIQYDPLSNPEPVSWNCIVHMYQHCMFPDSVLFRFILSGCPHLVYLKNHLVIGGI